MRNLGHGSIRLAALIAVAPLLLGSIGPRSNFNERVLASQNRERAAMSAPLLEWDDELASGASQWAAHLSQTGRFEHSPDKPGDAPHGENIWGGTPGHFIPEDMVGLWVAEKKNFKPGIFPANSVSGRVEDVSHYTQLIWRRSGKVGCAVNADGPEEILVCRYSEAGNVVGEVAL